MRRLWLLDKDLRIRSHALASTSTAEPPELRCSRFHPGNSCALQLLQQLVIVTLSALGLGSPGASLSLSLLSPPPRRRCCHRQPPPPPSSSSHHRLPRQLCLSPVDRPWQPLLPPPSSQKSALLTQREQPHRLQACHTVPELAHQQPSPASNPSPLNDGKHPRATIDIAAPLLFEASTPNYPVCRHHLHRITPRTHSPRGLLRPTALSRTTR
ncbi:hypothetical protein QBC39DRAFT_32076 [Podospora conica]|nr:hypothetical protein QBC39DRAFT_32076 [Schizothecium conicum]